MTVVNDISINDWFIFHDDGYNPDGTKWFDDRYVQIISIGQYGDIIVQWAEGNDFLLYKETERTTCLHLSQITLTDDFLEKNGFVYENGHWDYDKNDDSVGFRLYRIANGYVLQTDFRTIPIDSVHKLQHAFKLFNITKNFKL